MQTEGRERLIHAVPFRHQPAQWHFREAVRTGAASVSALFAGIGGGKTAAGQDVLFDAMTTWAPGGRFMIIVPSYKTFAQVTLPELRKFWPGEGTLWRLHRPDNQLQIDVYWGDGHRDGVSTCYVRSAQDLRVVEDIRGPTLAGIWGDEVGTWHAGRMAYDLAIGRLRMREPSPGLWTHRGVQWWPRMWLTGSPRWGWLNKVFGIRGSLPPHAWTTGLFTRYDRSNPDPRTAFYVRAARTEDNRYNAAGYAENLRLNYGEAFAKQELGGDFVSPTGAVFPGFYPDIHVIPATKAMELYHSCRTRVTGVDWGFGHPGAMVAVGIDDDSRAIIVRDWSHDGHTDDDMARIVRPWEDELRIQRHHCDPEGGQRAKNEHIERWRGNVRGAVAVQRPVHAANNAVEPGRNALRNCMRLQHRVSHPCGGGRPGSWMYVSSDCTAGAYSDDSLVDDLQVLQYADVAEGDEVDERKVKPKRATHRVAATRYAVYSELASYTGGTSWDPRLG